MALKSLNLLKNNHALSHKVRLDT